MIPDIISQNRGVVASVGGGSVLGILYGLDPTTFTHYLSATANSQIAQAGFFFTVAAWLHATTVKKEIKANFSSLTDAINGVATALRQDLQNHSIRLDKVEGGITELGTEIKEVTVGVREITTRVSTLEIRGIQA